MAKTPAVHNVSQRALPLTLGEEVVTLNEAISDTCKAIGYKRIAQELWPEKLGDNEASRYLSDCLNPDNPRKLSGEQILFIAARGCQEGVHTLMGFIASGAGYHPPAPRTKEGDQAELIKQFRQDMNRFETLFKKMRVAGLVDEGGR